MINPFFHRGAIHDPAYFAGRDYEVAQLLSLLRNGQSVSLIGQRRIGKTSLLFHVAMPEICVQHGLMPGEYLFVYIDCGSLSDLDQPGIYRTLLEDAASVMTRQRGQLETPLVLQNSEPVTYRLAERCLQDWLQHGQKLIFVLDEFERMSQNAALTPDFFSGLRALATRYPVVFVTASKQPLLDLTYANSSTLSSPFFNIFASIRLTLLSEATARALIQQLAAMADVTFAEQTVDAILALAGMHPLFLQMASYEAFELQQIKGETLTGADLPELNRRFIDAAEPHFAYYWHDLTAPEQQLLAMLPDASNSDVELLRGLEQKSLIVRRNERCNYLSMAFQAFVQTQRVPGLIQAGPLVIDARRRRVLLSGQRLTFTELQYDLLAYLAARPDAVIDNEELEHAIWGDEFIEDPERLKSVVKGLRRALGEEAVRLENVRGVGYRWRVLT